MRKVHVQTLSGKTISASVYLTDTVFKIKQSITEQLNVPVAEQRLLLYARQLENDMILSSLRLGDNSTMHLAVTQVGAKMMKYDKKYNQSIEWADNAMAALKTKAKLLAIESTLDLHDGIQEIMIMGGSVFSHKLPADYFMHLAAEMKKKGWSTLTDEELTKAEILMSHAMRYLKEFTNTFDFTKVANSWYGNPGDKIEDYLKAAISFSIVEAKMLKDEKTYPEDQRFFRDSEVRSKFINLYNDKRPITFSMMLDKYESYHN
jgi:hypothetical protein